MRLLAAIGELTEGFLHRHSTGTTWTLNGLWFIISKYIELNPRIVTVKFEENMYLVIVQADVHL